MTDYKSQVIIKQFWSHLSVKNLKRPIRTVVPFTITLASVSQG